MENSRAEELFQRFSVLHRLKHFAVIVTFTLLCFTGFALKFSHHWWAKAVIYMLGGVDSAGSLHRISASVFYLVVVLHLVWLGYYKLVLKGNLTGPQSVFPQVKDFKDLYRNFGYIFGKNPSPLFNRYSYLAKIDYWAVMLGMQSMGITGLLMCYPEFFSNFFQGYFINIANELHFHEAVLAVAYIAVVHMTDTHLSPEVFPMDKSIFTGNISRKRMMAEHPEEWKYNRKVPAQTAGIKDRSHSADV